ncbi:hypothetical protein WDW89_08710 [Deltaproteobacteria bacterium TL4]
MPDTRSNMFSTRQCFFFRFLMFPIFGLLFSTYTAAQTNFIPLERGDIKEKEDRWTFSPNVQLSGDYRFHAFYKISGTRDQKIQGQPAPNEVIFENDLRFRVRSAMHRIFSINLEMEVRQDPFNDSDLRGQEAGSRDTPDSQLTFLQARQAYFEYNSNPRSVVKLGKHYLNIGDRKGKVFSGILSGISQQCTAGTWCYEVGALRTAPNPGDWMYYLSLDYPFIDYKNADGSASNVFNVEIFRILYTERHIPLAKTNVPAPRPYELDYVREDIYAKDREDRIMAFDAFEQQYFGMRLKWETTHWFLSLDGTAVQGIRRLHLLPDEKGSIGMAFFGENTALNRHKYTTNEVIAGLVTELEVSYHTEVYRFGLMGLYASGDKEQADPSHEGANLLKSYHGYYEITPGTYQGTRFYFNGKSTTLDGGTGLGHSVNNSSVFGIRYHVTSEEPLFHYELGLYELNRVRSVFNERGDRVRHIGQEWDNRFLWNMDKHLHLEVEVNLFRPGGAFSYDDYTPPILSPELIIHGVGRLIYSF